MCVRKKVVSALAALLLVTFVMPVLAQTNPGLGASWPIAQDVSPNAQFHVYRWLQGGVTYVQVNDALGNVQFAVGAVNGVVFALPVGSAANVQVSQQPTSDSSSTINTLYSDASVTVQQTTSNFVAHPTAQAACKDPTDCTN